MKKSFLETGKITGTHGIRGMVRIQPWCDSFEFLSGFKRFYLDSSGETELKVERIAQAKNMAIVKFAGVDTVEQAEKYRDKIIYISRNDAKIEEGSYFIQDLIGCVVKDIDNGRVYGKISDVTQTGSNDVWHIKDGENEYLLPVIKEIVKQVDIDSETVLIKYMKGIFEDED